MEAGECSFVKAPDHSHATPTSRRDMLALTPLLSQAEEEHKIDLRLKPALETLGEHQSGRGFGTISQMGPPGAS